MINHALGLRTSVKVRELTQKYRDAVGNKKAVLLPSINWSGHSIQTEDETYEDNEEDNN